MTPVRVLFFQRIIFNSLTAVIPNCAYCLIKKALARKAYLSSFTPQCGQKSGSRPEEIMLFERIQIKYPLHFVHCSKSSPSIPQPRTRSNFATLSFCASLNWHHPFLVSLWILLPQPSHICYTLSIKKPSKEGFANFHIFIF